MMDERDIESLQENLQKRLDYTIALCDLVADDEHRGDLLKELVKERIRLATDLARLKQILEG